MSGLTLPEQEQVLNAALNGNVDKIEEICQSLQNLDINRIRDNHRFTPLHHACWYGHLEVVKYLVEEQKADIECQNNHGDTPLHHACRFGHLEVAKYLAEANGDSGRQNKKNETPLDLAERFAPKVASFLKLYAEHKKSSFRGGISTVIKPMPWSTDTREEAQVSIVQEENHYVLSFDKEWMEIPPPKIPRVSCGLAAYGDHHFIIVGGKNSQGHILHSVEMFSLKTRTWSDLPRLKTARSNCCTTCIDGRLLVWGGSHPGGILDDGEVLNVWEGKQWSSVFSDRLPTRRRNMVPIREKNVLYMIGGSNGRNSSPKVTAFDTILDCITEMEPMNEGRFKPGVGVVGQTIYVVGGQDKNGDGIRSCELLGTTRDVWKQDIPEMPLGERIAHVFVVEPKYLVVLTATGSKMTYLVKEKRWELHNDNSKSGRGLTVTEPCELVGIGESSSLIVVQDNCRIISMGCRWRKKDKLHDDNAKYSCALEGGANIDVGEITLSNGSYPKKVWGDNEPFIFVCHKGSETPAGIPKPSYWYLTEKLQWREFNEADKTKSPLDRMKAMLKAAYMCKYALIILPPDLNRHKWSVRELNTFMADPRNREVLTMVPSLVKITEMEGTSEVIREFIWMKNDHVEDDTEYMVDMLWPYLVETIGPVDESSGKDDLKLFLWEHEVNRLGLPHSEPQGVSPKDSSELSMAKAVIQEWLLKILPGLADSDLDAYTTELVEKGFDSLDILNTVLEPKADLLFMKKAHYKKVCRRFETGE